jgi:hypothetical protein
MSLDTEDSLMTGRSASESQGYKLQRRSTRSQKLFEPALVQMAVRRSFVMLNPVIMRFWEQSSSRRAWHSSCS